MDDPGDPRTPRPFSAGFAWLGAAVSLLRANAARLLLLGLLFQLLGGASQVGILGLLFVLAIPTLTAGMLQGCHLAALGERPPALVLFAGFGGGARLLSLFLLGGLTIAVTGLVLVLLVAGSVAQLDPETVTRIQAGDQSAVLSLDPALIQRMLFGMVLGLLLGACLSFFAVPLIWFQDRSLGDALVTGIVMLFRQWRALTALGLALAAIGLPVGILAGTLMAAQLTSVAPSFLVTLLLMAVVVVYQVLAFAAQYVAFREVFMSGSASPPAPPGDGGEPDDQLVA